MTYAHWKFSGAYLPQLLSNKLSESGTFRLIPNTLALRAVQRQTAASRSTSPSIKEQQSVLAGLLPITRCNKSPNKLAQAFSFSVSFGHFPFDDGVEGVGIGVGVGVGWCLWCGGGGHGTLVELTIVKKRMFNVRTRAIEDAPNLAIFQS
ncbi:hypothetical protein AABB24_034804 [Solanum stoloniferum]|uniref:Uncharacterized protein n=1 Tax=Solanum stoloniferum TaxID=62892 RepID=A0ABD2RJW2_9SOLN